MRYYRKGTIVLSEDDLSNPKEIRFQDRDRETTEKTIIKDGGGRSETVVAGTTDWEIPLGNVAQGKWFFLYSDKAFKLKIDNGSDLQVAAGKPCEMFIDFTSLKITNDGTEDMRLTWAIGGE